MKMNTLHVLAVYTFQIMDVSVVILQYDKMSIMLILFYVCWSLFLLLNSVYKISNHRRHLSIVCYIDNIRVYY